MAETADERELVAADDATIGLRDNHVVVFLVDEMLESVAIRRSSVGEDWIAGSTEIVVVEEIDDGDQVGPASDPARDCHRHVPKLTTRGQRLRT